MTGGGSGLGVCARRALWAGCRPTGAQALEANVTLPDSLGYAAATLAAPGKRHATIPGWAPARYARSERACDRECEHHLNPGCSHSRSRTRSTGRPADAQPIQGGRNSPRLVDDAAALLAIAG